MPGGAGRADAAARSRSRSSSATMAARAGGPDRGAVRRADRGARRAPATLGPGGGPERGRAARTRSPARLHRRRLRPIAAVARAAVERMRRHPGSHDRRLDRQPPRRRSIRHGHAADHELRLRLLRAATPSGIDSSARPTSRCRRSASGCSTGSPSSFRRPPARTTISARDGRRRGSRTSTHPRSRSATRTATRSSASGNSTSDTAAPCSACARGWLGGEAIGGSSWSRRASIGRFSPTRFSTVSTAVPLRNDELVLLSQIATAVRWAARVARSRPTAGAPRQQRASTAIHTPRAPSIERPPGTPARSTASTGPPLLRHRPDLRPARAARRVRASAAARSTGRGARSRS